MFRIFSNIERYIFEEAEYFLRIGYGYTGSLSSGKKGCVIIRQQNIFTEMFMAKCAQYHSLESKNIVKYAVYTLVSS